MLVKASSPVPSEHKVFPALVTKVDADQGIVDHIVAVMGNVDMGDDIIHPGAFTKTLAERGGKIRCLDQHRTDSIMAVIGKPLMMKEIGRNELPKQLQEQYPTATGGLQVRTQFLLDTPEGKGAFARIKSGAVDEFSIAYDAMPGGTDYTKQPDGKVVRNLRELRLWEYSPVIWGMNPATTVTAAKGANGQEEKPWDIFKEGDEFCVYKVDENGDKVGSALGKHPTRAAAQQQIAALHADVDEGKAASGSTGLPLAGRDRAWDAAAAVARVRTWADATEAPNAKYKGAFFWYDASASDSFGSYKLPFADVIDGTLTAVPRGIFACAGVMSGSRGGADIPAGDVAGVKAKIASYYKRMAASFEDDTIVVPWEKAGHKSVNLTDLVEDISEAFSDAYNTPNGLLNYWVREVFDDCVIVSCYGGGDPDYFCVAYTMAADGTVTFAPRAEWQAGDYVFMPTQQGEGSDMGSGGDTMPMPAHPMMGLHVSPSSKAGRVQAARNASRLRAMRKLVNELLADAGIEDNDDDETRTGKDGDKPAAKPKDGDKSAPHDGAGSAVPPTLEELAALVEIQLAEFQLDEA